MLKGSVNEPSILTIEGFLVAVEIEEGTDLEVIGQKLADSISFLDGTGQVEVNHLGQLELVPEDHPDALSLFDGPVDSKTVKES